MKTKFWLSCLLTIAMLVSCLSILTVPTFAENPTFETDEAAVEAGYVFRLNEDKYYKNLVDAHLDVTDGDTIYMLADYSNTKCDYVGWNAASKTYTDTKTYTIIGNGHTFTSSATHGLHFYSANVTIDGMKYVATQGNGNVGGMRVESTATVTLKNCTFEKTGSAANHWNPAIIVYGTLILDENSVVKNNDESAGEKSHALFMEGKNVDGNADTTIIPKLILKANATLDAKQCVIYEGTKCEITIESPNVKLISSAEAEHTGDWRKAHVDSVYNMAGPTPEDYKNPEVKAAWKDLYTKLGLTWIDSTDVDKETILSYKPEMGIATVRTKDDSYGLRFTTTISTDVINFANALVDRGIMAKMEYGTLIVRYEDIKEMTEITAETLTAANIRFLNVKAEKGIVTNKDGSLTLSTAMVNIKEENYGVEFCAISYISYTYADETLGTVTSYADPSAESSIADAAWCALTDVSEELVSGCTNPLHTYWKLENGEYVEVDGDVYTKYSKEQRETLLAFTSVD